ncbi:MAG: alanine racemase [Rhodospirillales bacterium]|nr:alanine racemase [Rhodospirillales bacterium]
MPRPPAPIDITEMLAGAVLTIDLDAVAANYRLLQKRLAKAEAAAVVKADAYGLGLAKVAPVLAAAGCRTFCVAHVGEAIALRQVLGNTAAVVVLNGLLPDAEDAYAEHALTPALGSLAELAAWQAECKRRNKKLPCWLHVDTGMLRLGLPPDELETLADRPGLLDGLEVAVVMSHLACADERAHPKNRDQLAAFADVRRRLPMGKASFANSAGVFLGRDFRFDIARPGVALYGVAPIAGEPNPMAQVVRLQAKILQVRRVDTPQTVGYGATHRVEGPGRIATVPVGYADGYLRSLSNRGTGYIGDIPVPVVGRVSMDLITLDVTQVPERQASVGALVDLIGPHNPVDRVAQEAGTIGYEILTSLGARYHRAYVGGI